jgi:hypothetical protein
MVHSLINRWVIARKMMPNVIEDDASFPRSEGISEKMGNFSLTLEGIVADLEGIPNAEIGDQIKMILNNDPESLGVLIKLEMNRRQYREKNGIDLRSSREVVKDAGVSEKSIRKLAQVIAKVVAKELMRQWGQERLAQTIIGSAKAIDRMKDQEAKMDDVVLGKQSGFVLDAVVEILAEKMSQKDMEQEIQKATQTLEEKRVGEALEGAKRQLFPPVKTDDIMDVESYLRAKKASGTMA